MEPRERGKCNSDLGSSSEMHCNQEGNREGRIRQAKWLLVKRPSEIALPGVANALASRRVSDAINLMQRVTHGIRERGLLDWQSGIRILVSPGRNRETRHLTYFEMTHSGRRGRIAMKFLHLIVPICLTCSCGGWTLAQDSNPPGSSPTNPVANPVLKHRPVESP